jgi:WD40 repeat protein
METMQPISEYNLPLHPKSSPYAIGVPPVFNVAFSPRDDLLAAVIQPAGGVQLWTTNDWYPGLSTKGGDLTEIEDMLVGAFPRSPDSLPTYVPRGDNVKFSPDGSVIASWIRGNVVRLWRVSDGQILKDSQPLSSGISSLAFSPDGAILAAGTWDGRIYQFRVK